MSTTAQQSALVRLSDLPDWARTPLQQYSDPAQYNLLLPAIPMNGTRGFGQELKVAQLTINPDPNAGETYKVGSKNIGGRWFDQLSLAKPALQRIGSAAGVQFKTARVDDRRDREYVEYECIAAVKNESGQVVVQSYRKSIDLRDVRESSLNRRLKFNDEATGDKKKSRAMVDFELETEIIEFRRHMAARCESGAILRAIRGQLGIKMQWTAAELAKPFVVLRFDFQPDATDPVVKTFLLERGARSASDMFGGAAAMAPQAVPGGSGAVVHDDSPETTQFTSDTPDASTIVTSVAAAKSIDVQVLDAAKALEVDASQLLALYRQFAGDDAKVLARLNEIALAGGQS